jgi:hypothetical protein
MLGSAAFAIYCGLNFGCTALIYTALFGYTGFS